MKSLHPLSGLKEIEMLLAGNSVCTVRDKGTKELTLLGSTLPGLKDLFMQCGQVLFFSSITQCNKGSYHIWHSVPVNPNGKSGSIYFGISAYESYGCYEDALRSSVQAMPSVSHVKAVVLDKHPAQYRAVRQFLPEVDIGFCAFHALTNFRHMVNSIGGFDDEQRENLHPSMAMLLYTPNEMLFNLHSDNIR